MTANAVIEYVDGIKPNIFSEEDKFGWINRLNGMISTTVHGESEAVQLKFPADGDTELIVPFPYDDVYWMYVAAMIDLHNREYSGYNNFASMFGDKLDEYKAYYIRRNSPAKADNFKNVMG